MTTTTESNTRVDTGAWRRMSRATGVTGLVAIALLFTPIVAISTLGEPGFRATAAEALGFFTNADVVWVQPAMAVTALAGVGFVWFVVAFVLVLARAEGAPPWRSGIALVSGVLLPAYLLLDVTWDAASYRGGDLDPMIARYAFDSGNLGFANVWLAMASFALASALVVLATRVFRAWVAWLAVVAAVGLLLSRFFWTAEVWFGPYALFWLWMIIVCVLLVRGQGRGGDRS